MAGNSKTFEALLKLKAKLDGSWGTTIRNAENQLKGLDKVTKMMGKGASNSFSHLAHSADKSFSHMETSASRAARKISSVFEGVKFGFGFGIGGALLSGGERLAGMIGEGSGVAAEREGIATQMRTILENQKQGDKLQSLLNQMRVYSDSESIFRYNTVAGAASQMLVSQYRPNEILPELRKLGELAKDDDTLKLVADIYSQGKNQGYVTKGLLTRLQKDAKVPIYSALLEAMHKRDNLKNETALFKQLRTPGKDPVPWQYMEKALNILTGPGGALYGHQKEQQQTFAGQLNSVKDRWADILSGMGGAFNKFALPMMNEINKISPIAIQDWFTTLTEQSQKFGQDLAKAFDISAKAGTLQDIGNRIGSIFGKSAQSVAKLFGVFTQGASTTDTVVAIIGKLDQALSWLDNNWGKVTEGVKRLTEAMIAFKAIQVVSVFASIANALVGINSGLAGMAGGMSKVIGLGESAAVPEVLGAGIGATAATSAVLGTGVGLAYLLGKDAYAGQDKSMTSAAILAQRSADLSQGGSKLGDADKNAAMEAHWKRSQQVHEMGNSAWKGMGDNWNNTMKTGADMVRPMTDWWNSLQAQLKASDDAQIHAADDAARSMSNLHASADPAASSLGKLPSAADAAVAALHAMAAQISSFKMPTVGGTASSTTFGRKLDDDLHDRLRRGYA
jgi:hypothetical protein